jgi:hypothetical protein
MINTLKIGLVSIVVHIIQMFVLDAVGENIPKGSTGNIIPFLITGWILVALCIENNKPLYKKALIVTVFIALAKTVYSFFILLYMINFNLSLLNIVDTGSAIIITLVLMYISGLMVGLPSVYWCAKTGMNKPDAERLKDDLPVGYRND